MRERLVPLCAVLLLSVTLAFIEVTAENTGYSVLVSFSQNVPPEEGKAIIEDVKASIQAASEVLHTAIGHEFSRVTFKIPESWDTSGWEESIEVLPRNESPKTDILVDSASDVVFGKFPFTVQYGGCGTPGHQLRIPTAFFNETNEFPKGTALAREWLKYRYGVFDENGYAGDPLYPLYYRIPGTEADEVKITECTDPELEYNFLDQNGDNCSTSDKPLIDQLNDNQCKIKIAENSSYDVISSIMYFQEDISTMSHICGKDNHTHNSRAPNKQNALCHGRSIWDVVKNSKDFQTEITEYSYGGEHAENAIEYVYAKEAKPTIIVAWENTVALTENNKNTYILNAIKKLVFDLPVSKFAAIPLKSGANADYAIDWQSVETMDDKKVIQIHSEFFESEPGNVVNAISKIVDDLLPEGGNKDEVEGNIFIITTNILQGDKTAIAGKLEGLNVCVNIFYIKAEDSEPDELVTFLEDYTTIPPCGALRSISITEANEEIFRQLYEMMGKVLPSVVDNTGIETVKTGFLTKDSPISIDVDDTVETVTFWLFSRNENSAFNMTLNGEEKTENVKFETYLELKALSYSPSQSGKVGLSLTRPATLLTQVRITSKAGKYFTGEIFVHDTSEEGSTDQMPVIIYAVVRFGAYPVQNAKVSAVIQEPNKQNITLNLNDDGSGNPDVTKNDGIYSRYFTQFTSKGLYTVTVTVESNGYTTSYGADENAGYQTCCGSAVNIPVSTPKLRPFSKVFKTTFTAKNGRPEDGYQPSRITDLRIGEVKDDKIVLEWSAPGGEADFGKAQSYEIKHFTSQEEAINNFDNGTALFDYSGSPKESGEWETFEINLSDFENSGIHYIAIKAKNDKKTSDISNIVEVYAHEKATDAPDEEKDDKENVKKSSPKTKTVGIVIGVIVGLLVLAVVIYLVVYFVIVKPKRKNKSKGKDNPIYESNPRADNNAMNPINFVSADTLIRHHNEKAQAKIENKEPPILKEEDFENKNSESMNESGDNTDQPESSNKTSGSEQPLPPKSPKRTTLV